MLCVPLQKRISSTNNIEPRLRVINRRLGFCQAIPIDKQVNSSYNKSLVFSRLYGGVKVSTGIVRHSKRVAVRTRYKSRNFKK